MRSVDLGPAGCRACAMTICGVMTPRPPITRYAVDLGPARCRACAMTIVSDDPSSPPITHNYSALVRHRWPCVRSMESFQDTHYADLRDPKSWKEMLGAAICVLCAALAAGLTVGLMSLDPLELEVKRRVGTPDERRHAEKVSDYFERHTVCIVQKATTHSFTSFTVFTHPPQIPPTDLPAHRPAPPPPGDAPALQLASQRGAAHLPRGARAFLHGGAALRDGHPHLRVRTRFFAPLSID